MIVRPSTPSDLKEILAIETVSFPHPWSAAAFTAELGKSPPTLYVAGRQDQGRVDGYICFWPAADEIQLLNLAVRPDCRRRGVGRHLMQYLLQKASEEKMRQIFLEVRPSNCKALGLYRSLGFEVRYRRRGYYSPEGEDALVMSCPAEN